MKTLVDFHGVSYLLEHEPTQEFGQYEDIEVIEVNGLGFSDPIDQRKFNGWFLTEEILDALSVLIDESRCTNKLRTSPGIRHGVWSRFRNKFLH